MFFLKIYYHIIAEIKKIFYKIIYGKKVKFGKKVTFRKGFSLVIEGDAYVEIGDGCFFNNYCSINAKEKVIIGNNCLFGECVKIYDHNHVFKYKDMLIKKQGFKTEEIKIGKNNWIGSDTIILKGTNIGNNCVIQAKSLINFKILNDYMYRNNELSKINMVEKNESYRIDEHR